MASRLDYRLVVGDWDLLQVDAQALRYAVFVVEQQVPPELEIDHLDPHCVHAVAYAADGVAFATGRLLPDGHIGRMAVCQSARGSGIGSALLRCLMQVAQQRGARAVMLSAQLQAESFYQRHGFVREGEEYLDAGIVHILMRHVLR